MHDPVFEPLHEDFGARVRGIDLTRNLDASVVTTIRDAMDRYSVLVFPEQAMSDQAQLALTRKLGEPEPNHVTRQQPVAFRLIVSARADEVFDQSLLRSAG